MVGRGYRQLECTPDHASFGSRHAADAEVVLWLELRGNRHGCALGAVGGFRDAARPRVVQLANDLPAVEAGLARLTDEAVGVVASVLVERNCVLDVIDAHEVAAPSAVMASEEPSERLVADETGEGRLVWLPVRRCGLSCHISQVFFRIVLAGRTAQTPTQRFDFVLL